MSVISAIVLGSFALIGWFSHLVTDTPSLNELSLV